jgi:hypothetical protein
MRYHDFDRSQRTTGATSFTTRDYAQYDSPEALARDARLSPRVRLQMLTDWAEDLTDRLRASDENMPSGDPGEAGEILRRVHVCAETLGGMPVRH